MRGWFDELANSWATDKNREEDKGKWGELGTFRWVQFGVMWGTGSSWKPGEPLAQRRTVWGDVRVRNQLRRTGGCHYAIETDLVE